MKALSVLLLVPLLLVLPATAFGSSIVPTDGGALNVNFSTVPEQVRSGQEVQMNIVFINPTTQKTQIHIDYFVTVLEGDNQVFGPTNRIHTSEGKASIPIQFQRDGEYKVKIDVDGILFNVIPLETVSFNVIVGDIVQQIDPNANTTNGCLIATAAFGSELSGQVQTLREIRDNSLLATKSGTVFMTGFNQFYYSFSPTIADWERQNPIFKETVKVAITPLLSTLSLLNHVDMDSEEAVLGYGMSIIALNLGMYVGLPVIGFLKVCQLRKN